MTFVSMAFHLVFWKLAEKLYRYRNLVTSLILLHERPVVLSQVHLAKSLSFARIKKSLKKKVNTRGLRWLVLFFEDFTTMSQSNGWNIFHIFVV